MNGKHVQKRNTHVTECIRYEYTQNCTFNGQILDNTLRRAYISDLFNFFSVTVKKNMIIDKSTCKKMDVT